MTPSSLLVIYRRVKPFIILLSMLMNLGLLIICFTPVSEWMHGILRVGDPPHKGQVIVVLASTFPFDTQNGVPGMSTLMRLEKGLRLYRDGYADKIVVVGGIWMERARKSVAQAMEERLLLYGVPADDIIVHDDLKGTWAYYDNLLLLFEKYKELFDFNQALFVTSSEQSYRIRRVLQTKLEHPIVVISEPYEFSSDWGRRFHLFRRVANEMLVAIPAFYFSGRF